MNLIIGYGNWLRMDDGLGPWMAALPRPAWHAIAAHQLLPEHAEVISRAERVVFVDAEVEGEPGQVRSVEVTPLEADITRALGAFTHNATPATLLAAARELYGCAPPALLITVTGAEFGHGAGFSEPIRARLSEIEAAVDEALTTFAGKDAIISPLVAVGASPP